MIVPATGGGAFTTETGIMQQASSQAATTEADITTNVTAMMAELDALHAVSRGQAAVSSTVAQSRIDAEMVKLRRALSTISSLMGVSNVNYVAGDEEASAPVTAAGAQAEGSVTIALSA
jgi:WXG100 family type VII secretion target